MRIATWNAARGKPERKLPVLREAYAPHCVAVQEIANPIGELADASVWRGTNKNQGSLVWAATPYKIDAIRELAFETELYVATRVRHQGKHLFNIVNLWVKPYQNRPKGRSPYGYSLHTALTKAMELRGDEVTVVLGDTNILNPQSKDYFREFVGHYGLFSSYHEFFGEASGEEKQPTFRHSSTTEHHIDFLFLPEEWRKGLRQVIVGSPEKWCKHSDHFPIVVEIDDTVIFDQSSSVKKRRRAATTAGGVTEFGTGEIIVSAG